MDNIQDFVALIDHIGIDKIFWSNQDLTIIVLGEYSLKRLIEEFNITEGLTYDMQDNLIEVRQQNLFIRIKE